MIDLFQVDFDVSASGTARGRLSERVFHLISTDEGKHYICNPKSEEVHEISWVEEIKSLRSSSLRVNIHYKIHNIEHIKAITLEKSIESSNAIKKIKDAIQISELTPLF